MSSCSGSAAPFLVDKRPLYLSVESWAGDSRAQASRQASASPLQAARTRLLASLSSSDWLEESWSPLLLRCTYWSALWSRHLWPGSLFRLHVVCLGIERSLSEQRVVSVVALRCADDSCHSLTKADHICSASALLHLLKSSVSCQPHRRKLHANEAFQRVCWCVRLFRRFTSWIDWHPHQSGTLMAFVHALLPKDWALQMMAWTALMVSRRLWLSLLWNR